MSRDELIDLSGDDRSRCPVCGGTVAIDSSERMGNERCPCCGEMLFWLRSRRGWFMFYRNRRPDRLSERVIEIIARRLGVDKSKINASLVKDLGADSLDTVALVMELEELEMLDDNG